MVLTIFGQRFRAPQEEGGDGGGAAVADTANDAPESEYLTEEPEWSRDDFDPKAAAAETEETTDEDTAGAEAATESGEQTVSGDGTPKVSASTAPAALDPRFYDFGQSLGLSRELVDKLGEEGLRPLIDRELARSRAQQPAGTQTEPDAAEAAKAAYEEFKLGDEYEEGLQQFTGHVNKHLKTAMEKIAELEGKLTESNKHLETWRAEKEREAQEEANRQFDALFDEREEELYGRGRYASLATANKTAADNRVRVARLVSAIEREHVERGEAPPDLKVLVEQAERALFGDRIKQQTLQEIAEKSKRQRGGTAAKPTHKEPLPKSAEAKAALQIEEFYRERGAPEDDESGLLE